ncbi:MAG: hypothetical protein HQ478_04205 [Chloroflexi bacterium]|nr:hypothetical protein [Chloroflexota bacterium]
MMKRMSGVLALAIMITVLATVFSGSGARAAIGAPETLAVRGANVLVNGDTVAFRVRESAASSDLNGDGDATDFVIHLYKFSNGLGSTTNTGLAGSVLQLGDHFVWLSVSESQMGTDLNLDGDTTDDVVQAIDRTTGILTSSRLPLTYSDDRYRPSIVFTGDTGYFNVTERGAGVDLNGDGDTLDNVVHHWAPTDGAVINTGHASFQLMSDDTFVAYLISEAAQGVSFNPDNDMNDAFLAFTGVDGTIQMASSPVRGARLSDGILLTEFQEDGNLLSDFNGDGDANDSILHFMALPNPAPINLGYDSFSSFTENGLIAFTVRESITITDINGDGDVDDDVVFTHDGGPGAAVNSGISGSLLRISGRYAIFGSSEVQAGPVDLNGDGDSVDFVFHTVDIPTGALTNHGLVIDQSGPVAGNEFATVFADETGTGVDLNGDGDNTDGRVLHLFNSQTAALTNLGLVTGFPNIEGFRLTFGVFENEQGGTDLNGDGDATDEVFYYMSAIGGDGPVNLGLTGHAPHLQEGLVILPVSETQQASTDLNGDGDTFDRVTHIFDPAGASITNLGGSDVFPQIGATQLAYNLNGSLNVAQRFDTDVVPIPAPDLSILVSPTNQSVTTEELAAFEIQVLNFGTSSADSATVEIDAGIDIANVAITTSQGACAVAPTGAICDVSMIGPDGFVTLNLDVQYTAAGTHGILVTVRDQVSGREFSTSATATVTEPLTPDPVAVNYRVTAPANTTSTVYEPFTFAIEVTNLSPDQGGTFLLTALLPLGATVQSHTFSGGDVSSCRSGGGFGQNLDLTFICGSGGLAAGETATLDLVMTASELGLHPVMVSVAPLLGDSAVLNNVVVSLVNVVEPPPPPAINPVSGLPNFAAYATTDDGFAVGTEAIVADGAIGSNGLIEIGEAASVGDVTAGGWVYLGPDSSAEDVITTDTLFIEETATVTSIEEGAITEFLTLPSANAQPFWGANIWRNPGDAALSLVPGSYGILESSENDTITVTSGDYDFTHVQINSSSTLVIEIRDIDGDGISDPAVIRAAENIEFGDNASVEIIGGTASDVLFLVDGGLIWLGANGQYAGTYVAANGKVKLGLGSTLQGSAYGNHIWLKDASTLNHVPYGFAIYEFSSNQGGVYVEPVEVPVEEPIAEPNEPVLA